MTIISSMSVKPLAESAGLYEGNIKSLFKKNLETFEVAENGHFHVSLGGLQCILVKILVVSQTDNFLK